ncbi:MAG: AtpZ/AtpI family protein [Chitinophagaceae bacterium]|nr:MAG: AtpZ/AtpI family protein [Chitinophagaceae bacterium]
MNAQPPKSRSNSSELMRYAGLGAQFFVTIGLMVWLGYKADKWLRIPLPLLVWLLPLLSVGLLIYKLVKETSKPK